MKSITIAGNIGRDAVLRNTQGGDQVSGFPVAIDDGYGDKKRTLWFDVSLWGSRAVSLSPYLTKGTKVAVTGDLSTREHEGKTYLTVRANDITLLGGGEKQEREPTGGGQSSSKPSQDFGLDDSDIPFITRNGDI